MNYIIDGRTTKVADHYTIETIGSRPLYTDGAGGLAGGRNGQKGKD